MTFEDQMARANNQADMFNTDAVVKFVLEGHDRGVNWVSLSVHQFITHPMLAKQLTSYQLAILRFLSSCLREMIVS
jgi:hypothetical protein